MQVNNATTLIPNRGLFWQLDNENVATDNRSTVQMNFSRPVRNLAFSMEDIDVSTLENGGSDFVDEVTFNAYAIGSSTPYQLSAADVALGLNGSNAFVSGTNTIVGVTNNSGPAGTVVLTFPPAIAIARLEIIYRNTQTYQANRLRLQTINLPSMVWCAEVDLATTLTGPARAIAGQTVTYSAVTTNQGDIAAAGVQASVQLSAGLTNVTINGTAAGTNYNSTTGVLTLPPAGTLAPGASSTATITFTMPTPGPVTGRASSTTTGLDIEPTNNNGSLPNAQVTTVINRPPTAQNVTAPTMPNSNAATDIPSLQGSDPDGDNTIANYVISALPNTTTQGTLSYTRAGATITLATGNTSSLADRTLTPAEMTTLRFDPVLNYVGNATFSYVATDDLGATSNTATYTIPVGAAAGATDLAVTQQVNLGPYLVGDQVTFTVVASNTGSPALNVQVRDALPAGLTFVSATTTQGAYDNATGVWTVTSGTTTFASGASATLTITARINQNGTFTNTSTITSTTAETNPLNNEASQQVNAGEAAYRQNFEGRTPTDICETYVNMTTTNTAAQVIAGNTSLVTGTLTTTASSYTSPLLRLTNSSSVAFQFRATSLTGTPRYNLRLVNSAGALIAETGFTNIGNTNATSQSFNLGGFPGLARIQIAFDALGAGAGQAILDEMAVTNASVATQAKDGSNCDANILPVASDVSFRIANGAAATTIPSLAGTDTAPGVVDSYIIQSVPNATTQGLLTLNGVAVSTGQIITAAQAATLQFDPVAGFVGEATFLFSAIDNSNELSANPATYTISIENATTISGRIYDDVNYGGGAGRDYTTANASAVASSFANNSIARGGAVVELYDVATNQMVNTLTTAADGTYSFPLVLSGNYAVRVVNSTVTSVRNATATGVLAVQTFVNGDVNRVGGEVPTIADAPQNNGSQTFTALNAPIGGTSTLQSVATVVIPAVVAAATNVDFGFNFNVITNTNDAGAGSLRQFILNSNALPNTNLNQVAFNGTVATGTTAVDPAAGVETSIFMIGDGRTSNIPAGLRSGVNGGFVNNVATITLATALPNISAANTALDGSKQTTVTGNNIASSTTVGSETTGPEVVVDFNSVRGLVVTGANTRIASVGLSNARGSVTTTGTPTFSDGAGVTINGAAATGSVVTDVTALNNAIAGVRLDGGATGVTVSNNVLRSNVSTTNGTTTYDADGINLVNASTNIITGNVMSSNRGWGLLLATSGNNNNFVSANTILNNGNGASADNAGISIQVGNNNLFSQNTITGNAGDGIVAQSGTSGNRFTQNSFSGNGDLGIDLTNNATVTGNGISTNDDGDADTGANGLLNFPVITQLSKDGTNVRILGYAPANAVVEFYVADVVGADFGEGRTYLAARTEGNTTDDADTRTGSYSGLIYGADQGSENNARRFSFTIPLASLNAAQLAALNATNARITATATILSTTLVNGVAVGNTSEFSGNAIVSASPLPVELKAFEVAARNASALLTWSTASEKNNDHFDVERSFDGRSFERIGQVQGRGTTSQTTTYSFTDANVGRQRQGVVYYRLQQVDTDGTVSSSPVRTVSFPATTGTTQVTLGVFPNPATTLDRTATLDLATLPRGTYQATVLDATGRIMGSYEVQGGVDKAIDVQALPAGTYIVLVRGNGLSLNQRLIKK
ncbi:DUF11 domain-containing protein [Hymenobacter sp. BT190]|nr:DUF11 domain-containing protein [Hymenobacter sp. BT190]